MHRKILEEASAEQIKVFTTDFITMLKARDNELYEEAEEWLYRSVYGCHFSKVSLDKAVNGMINEDGTRGAHWTVEQTNQVAQTMGVKFERFNEYDWNYVMNMIYSDYYGVISNNVETYAALATRFLCDKDAGDGKAYKYFLALKK